MPQDWPIGITGTATAADDVPLVVSGFLAPGGSAELDITGTLSTTVVESWTATSWACGVAVKIAGAWIPDENLVGSIQWRRSIDTWRKSARVTLSGKALSVFQTINTWTRQPAEIWTYQGPVGAVQSTLELRGHVRPGTRQSGGVDPVIEIEIDDTGYYDDERLCAEVAPDSGLTRGAIARAIAASGGLTTTRIPDGDVYDRPFIAADQELGRALRELGDPVGWSWRIVPEGAGVVLEAYQPRLKVAPQVPDDVWTPADWDGISIQAPERPASRVIVRGLVAVSYDEAEIETEIRKTTVTEVFTLSRAAEEQDTSGTITPISDPSGETTGVTLELITTVRRRAGKELSVYTLERSYRNPKGAVLRTPDPAEGDGTHPDGYHYCASYIDAEGEYRLWRAARFGDTSERRITNTYDGTTGKLSTATTDVYRWFERPAGVKSAVAAAWVTGVSVGTDDNSYLTVSSSGSRRTYQEYGLAERHIVTYTYGDAGAVVADVQTSYDYTSPRAAVDVSGHYVRYDGSGQEDLVANFIKSREVTRREEVVDGLVLSRTEREAGYHVLVKRDGAYDYGGGEASSRVVATWRTYRSKAEVYVYRTDGGVDKLTFSTGDVPRLERVSQVPAPRYGLSAWTVLRQTTGEAIVDDPAIAELFGVEVLVVNSATMTSIVQALEIAQRQAQRSRAHRVTVQRLLGRVREGDTVLLLDPGHGIADRALVVDVGASHDIATGARSTTYELEVYP